MAVAKLNNKLYDELIAKRLLGPGIEPGANAWEALRLPLPHPSPIGRVNI